MHERGRSRGNAVDRAAVGVERDRAGLVRLDSFVDPRDDRADPGVGERAVDEARAGEARAALQLCLCRLPPWYGTPIC
jgi:hypothetical protein